MAAQPSLMFGLGATRAGTSWLNRYLSDHPECHLREIKEAHYFDTLERGSFDRRISTLRTRRATLEAKVARAVTDPQRQRLARSIAAHDALIALFERRCADHAAYLTYLHDGAGHDTRLVGEITPAYALLSVASLQAMRVLAPVVRFFYVLRDPVARLWSNIRQTAPSRPGGQSDPDGVAHEMLDRWLEGGEREIDLRSDYRSVLERITVAIPERERLFLTFETLFSAATIRKLTDFLGISYKEPDTARRVYSAPGLALSSEKAEAARERLAPQYACIENYLGKVPQGWNAPPARS